MPSNLSPPHSPQSEGRNPHAVADGRRGPGPADYPSPPMSPQQQTEAGPPKVGPMGPPAAVSRSGSTASRSGGASAANVYPTPSGYASMGSASVVLQSPVQVGYAQPLPASLTQSTQHPPSKLATGGQSHSHRPVSAMPAPTDRSSNSSRNNAKPASTTSSNVFATMGAGYNERRASAHPTMSSSHSSSTAGNAPPLPPGGAGLDPSTSQAISSGIPITSPAAISYFAAHPRRQQVHFGNYLLLQTLGEGEFGKVKLGVHKEWGEEVAVKLIKREKVGTNGGQLQLDPTNKDPAKMSKVEREIQVLKDVRHPNIVRLYEVIESDRYIGIVLEYASGGELFDHILAHKYLKEEHACRLFAQLISGVSYLHRKKIVHRDLKLENLLLDRNRNVIITDFGFANNFEDRRDDLMATSCGSPCYAAPELVVQDGLYAGSAVDVWSCGVILYAMLAGYLPFDDDPANPDGDNINLLYKYIMATPLSFPDYISAEPRDLLSRMLVPDPLKRADLNQVMSHSWLSAYRDLFRFSVEDLERAAVEQQTKKRQVYRQQMLYQQQLQEQQKRQQLERSQSTRHVVDGTSASAGAGGALFATGDAYQAVRAQRHQSAMASTGPSAAPDRSVEPAPPADPNTLGVPNPRTGGHASRSASGVDPVTAQGNARGEPRTRLDDPASASSPARKRDSTGYARDTRDSEHRKPASAKTQRHTIQLEYTADAERSRRSDRSTSTADALVPPVPRVKRDSVTTTRAPEAENFQVSVPKLDAVSPSRDAVSPAPRDTADAGSVVVPESEALIAERTAEAMARTTSTASSRAGVPSPILESPAPPPSSSPVQDDVRRQENSKATQLPRLPSTAPSSNGSATNGLAGRGVSNPLPASGPISFPPSGERVASAGFGASPEKRSRHVSRPSTAHLLGTSNKATPDRTNSRHRKGMSTDKFFLSRLLGAQSSNSPGPRAVEDLAESRPHSGSTVEGARPSPARPAVDRSPSSNGRSGSRRKAMSLVVARPGNTSPASRDRDRAVETDSGVSPTTNNPTAVAQLADRRQTDTASEANSNLSAEGPATPSVMHRHPSTASSRPPTSSTGPHGPFNDESTIGSASTGPSSNAAKKVMDWFRKKSLSRGGFNEQPPLGPFERSPPHSQARAASPGTPHVVVTGTGTAGDGAIAGSSVPSSRSTSGTHSQHSEATDATQITTLSEASQRTSNGVKSSASTVQQPTPKASSTMIAASATPQTPGPNSLGQILPTSADGVFSESRLRYHLGAVDQSALTSRSPVEVFAEVQQALFDMGIHVWREKDEDFKLECVRRKRPKNLISATQGLGLSIRTSVFPPSQAEVERSSRSSNALAMSTSASLGGGAGGSIRSFLRRGPQPAGSTGATSPKAGSGLLSPSATTTQFEEMQQPAQGQVPPPLYGDASVDGGQEIRFSVEVTRIKNLPGLYSLDIRRMKGNLWAYKFVYHALLDRCQLGSSSGNSNGTATQLGSNGHHALHNNDVHSPATSNGQVLHPAVAV